MNPYAMCENAGFCETRWTPLAPLSETAPILVHESYRAQAPDRETLAPVVEALKRPDAVQVNAHSRRISGSDTQDNGDEFVHDAGWVRSASAEEPRTSRLRVTPASVVEPSTLKSSDSHSDLDYFRP